MEIQLSISSRTGCPPDIVNEEDHNVDDNEIPNFTNWTIPKVDTKDRKSTRLNSSHRR